MMRRSAAWHTLCFLVGGLTLLTSGCTDNQIGRLCNNPSQPVKNGVTFVNPAPDCPSRLCMIFGPSNSTLAKADHKTNELSICTAECNSDDDCVSQYDNGSGSTKCGKYVCAVASVVGGAESFCCKKLCICDADLQPGFNTDGPGPKLARDSYNVPIPTACQNATSCTQ
jgi:hypothetical protein